jgi:electron transfer flavoprotein alpha subunit
MAQGILVFIEQRQGQIRKSSLEALSEGRRLAQSQGTTVSALVVGSDIKNLVGELSHYKPNNILIADNAAFANYSTEGYAKAVEEAIKKTNPAYVFAAHTQMAKDLMPRLAARFDAPMASDVIEIKANGQKLEAVRTVYSSKANALIEFNSDIVFMTLRPNRFAKTTLENGTPAPSEELPVAAPNIRAAVKETQAAKEAKIDLSEASVVVSGGRGIKGPENWNILQALCDVLGGALGASRAVVDAGWIDHQHQVGQTGKTVSPNLYIACGISGAIQHLAGMNSSKVIVAINKDPEAPIFKHATYGIVGDVFEVVPKLTEEIRKLNAQN